jgi:hypothetical protein
VDQSTRAQLIEIVDQCHARAGILRLRRQLPDRREVRHDLDVEAMRAILEAKVDAASTMIERSGERFGLKPERLAADTVQARQRPTSTG